MAKWGGLPTRPKRPPAKKYLYLQCDCEDHTIYGPAKGWSVDAFLSRYVKAQQVYVARTTDFLIPVEMSDDRELDRCAWINELGQYEFVTMTRDKEKRSHVVKATVFGGMETEWVCKHCITVARFICRRMWSCRHLFVHLANDPFIKDYLEWHKHLACDDWKEPKRMWLTRHVRVTGWGHYDYKSNLFGQKGEVA